MRGVKVSGRSSLTVQIISPTRSEKVITKRMRHADNSHVTTVPSRDGFLCKNEKSHLRANNVLEKLTEFTGREAELCRLAQSFVSTAPFSPKQRVVRLIYGFGGIGKTELARAFAQDYEKNFSFVWFINSATDAQKNQSYKALAEAFSLRVLDDETPAQVEAKVYSFLENNSADKPWLLVYDNVERAFENPPTGGCVLITSRTRDVWARDKECLSLTEFSEQESVELFSKITEQNSPHLSELVKELGYFPPALYQAASYIRRAGSIGDYLKALKKNPIQGRMLMDEARYHHTVRTVWQTTLQNLEKDNPKACAWFKICAFLNPDEIPQKWMTGWLEKQLGGVGEWDKMDITKTLGDWSLIRKRDNRHSVHRLLQQVTRESQDEQAGLRQACDVVIDHHHPGKERFENWKQAELWMSQEHILINF